MAGEKTKRRDDGKERRERRMEQAIVVSQDALAEGIYSLILRTRIAKRASSGQFVSLYCNDGTRLLPRPISICGMDGDRGELRLVYRVAGKGTEEFSRLHPGDAVRVMGPLGNGFPLRKGRALVVGGGIGVPPMLQLAKELRKEGTSVTAVLGYRSSDTFLLEEFRAAADDVITATDDGSLGMRGTVVDAMRELGIAADVMYACGPIPMLRNVKEYAQERGICCYISLEERMACGVGACLACVCASAETDAHSNVRNKRVCKDGPVFLAQEVEL